MLKPSGCGSFSGSEFLHPALRFALQAAPVLIPSAVREYKPSPDFDLAACSALSTEANRSLISVPVYKCSSLLLDLE